MEQHSIKEKAILLGEAIERILTTLTPQHASSWWLDPFIFPVVWHRARGVLKVLAKTYNRRSFFFCMLLPPVCPIGLVFVAAAAAALHVNATERKF